MSPLRDLSRQFLVRFKWQDLDMTAYITVISPSRLVLDAMVGI